MNVIARVLHAYQKKSFKCNFITRENLIRAEKYWLSQSMILTNEAHKKGHLDSLCPKLNEDGVLVLGSRALKGL